MGCGKYLHLGAEKFSTDTLFLVFHHTETLWQLSLELTSESKSFIICHHGTNKKEQIPWKCLIVVYSTSPKVCDDGGKGVGLLCTQKIQPQVWFFESGGTIVDLGNDGDGNDNNVNGDDGNGIDDDDDVKKENGFHYNYDG